jgi:3-hydroxyisobutyrate dehydrogenase
MISAISRRAFSTSGASMDKIAFVGLGNMGGHMAANLVKAGHEVTVFDVSQAAVDTAVSKGAKAAASAAEAAAASDTFISMLPSNPHVKAVYGDVIDAAPKGSLFLDCSTIDPNVAKEVAAQAVAAGHRMADAPVSGGVGGAEAGTLTFMVGGDDEVFAEAKPVLEGMGANIVHCGAVGTGQVAKICNNLILGISMTGVAEAMNLGVKLGADPKILAGIINTSSGRCWSSDTYNPCPGVMEGVPASRGYTGGFGSKLIHKDLGLALDAAKSVGAPLPSGSVVHSLYGIMSSIDAGDKDFSAVYELLSGGLTSKSRK